MLAKPKRIPRSPGVYAFRKGATPLYIGKAANLKQRLASYFQNRAQLPLKIQKMLTEATRLETIETPSEVEALIKEAELIKKHRPKYNLLMRDDKSYFYVAFTKETFPRIFITHEPRSKALGKGRKLGPSAKHPVPRYIGPFTSGTALRATLKLLRRVFPYCTCKRPHKRPCLNSEIGRCPGYCCTTEVRSLKSKVKRQRREYRKNIRNTIAVLSGERTRLIGRLKRGMQAAVNHERYEEAARLRDAIFGLEDIFAHRHVLHAPEVRSPWPAMLAGLQSMLKTKRGISRIEGYDISNIAGREATGSVVVFINGEPDKGQYRKFRIRTVRGANDVAMLKEVLRRRFSHVEWPFPQLIVIDGGKPQLNAALNALYTPDRKFRYAYDRAHTGTFDGYPVFVSALAKREEILYTADGHAIPLQRQDPAILHLFQRIRDESHRFARRYHHVLRRTHFATSVQRPARS